MTDSSLYHVKLVSKYGDLAVHKGSNEIYDPDNKVSDTGEGNEKTNYEGYQIVGVKELENSVRPPTIAPKIS